MAVFERLWVFKRLPKGSQEGAMWVKALLVKTLFFSSVIKQDCGTRLKEHERIREFMRGQEHDMLDKRDL